MLAPDIYTKRPPLQRQPQRLGRRMVALAFVVTLAIAAAIAIPTYRHRINACLQDTAGGVKMLALSFSEEELATLRSPAIEANMPIRSALEARLKRVKDSNPYITVAQLLHYDSQTGQITNLVSSQPEDSPASASPDDITAIQTLLLGPGTFVRLLSTKEYPHLIEGYSIVSRRPSSGDWFEADIVHYQLNARSHVTTAFIDASLRALGVLLIFVLPFAVYLITRGKVRQERALHELTSAIDQCETAFSICTLQHHNVYANEGLVRQYGYSREELCQIKWWELFVETPNDTETPWRTLFEPGAKPRTYEVTLRRKDGKIIPVRLDLTPLHIKHSNGKDSFCCISISTDLSEIKRSNRLLDEAKQRAEDASRVKSAFIAMMSHEVRTPLNGIIGFASLLLDTPLTPAQADSVRSLQIHGKSLVHVAEEVLDISRIESGGILPQLLEYDPATLAIEAINAAYANGGNSRIRIHTNIQSDIPEHLLIDFVHLRQILIHLIRSAARHIQEGVVDIGIQHAPASVKLGTRAPYEMSGLDTYVLQISVTGTDDRFRGASGGNPTKQESETPCSSQIPEAFNEQTPLALVLARRILSLTGCGIIRDVREPGIFVFVFSALCQRSTK